MERLTYDFAANGQHCWQVKGADNALCKEVCKDQGDSGCKDRPIAKAFDRLAAYEDTGLEPDSVEEAKETVGRAAIELAYYHKAEAEGRLLVLETAPRDSYKGLKRKYIVFKSDSGEPVENCFVLRPDKDPAAKIALEAYAKATDNKTLADDITRWIGDSGKVLVLPCKVGDAVYLPTKNDWGDLLSFEVIEIGVDRDGQFFVIDDEEHDHIPMSDIGADVFLSREEAEEALAKEAT